MRYNEIKYRNLTTGEEFEGLEILSEFDTSDIIDEVNRYSFYEYQTESEWQEQLNDADLLELLKDRGIDSNSEIINSLDELIDELIIEIPKEVRTMHFNVILDRIKKEIYND